jgi:serine/threonine-protein kinase
MSEGVGFGNYRLLRRLARGGMAEVFLARQQGVEGFERRVAIKRILPHLSDSTEFRSMFLDEARLAAQLTHPNIIHIYDFGKVEDYFYIAMEYVEGVDLGRLIKHARNTPVPFELIARVLADICAGLHYAHNITDGAGKRLNVVHRDVTPQNVLVTYDGIVKVVDFGIAKATWQASRTRPGVVKGKYAYMSPEQVEGRSLDARSDVFSVGICMYELMTGMPLFRRDNVVEAMKEIRDGKPIHLEQFRSDIPSELQEVLRRALETARDQRYATAAAMQLDLERYLKGAAGMATPQQLSEFLRREAPPGPPGELLVEGKDGEPVVAPKPAPVPEPPPPSAAHIAVKGGTAPLSSVKGAIAPAYASAPVKLPAGPPTAKTAPSATDDKTTPGKHVRSLGPTSARGFAQPADDDLTRKEDRTPDADSGDATTRSPKMTPPTGERSLPDGLLGSNPSERIAVRSGPHERTAQSGQHEQERRSGQHERSGKSGQHERKSGQHERSGPRSGPFPGSAPLGSYPPESEPRPVLSDEPTTMNELPSSPRRWRTSLWLSLAAIAVAGGAYAVRHLAPGARALDPAPVVVLDPPTAVADLALSAPSDAATKAASDPAMIPKVNVTALPVQTSASIAVYTRPTGAKVFIDGAELDALTPVRMQPVTAGPHHVVIERVGCQPRELDVSLATGEHRVLDIELPTERSLQTAHDPTAKKKGTPVSSSHVGNGFLTAKTVPWSRAYEGSHLLGETPVVNVPLPEGPHTITFVNPDLPPVKKTILIKVGEETKLNFALQDQ